MRAGYVSETSKSSGDWVFIDVGFSRDKKTSGFLLNDGNPTIFTFSELRRQLVDLSSRQGKPMNLVLEAPLSAAFTESGNPAGRSMERNGKEHRYWYAGLGCQVTMAAAYLLRAVFDNDSRREVRLFEAFVSFKSKEIASSHVRDVVNMRAIAWNEPGKIGRIISPEELLGHAAKTIESSFKVFGFNCGVPPVIVAEA